MSIQLRQATKADCPRILELINELAVYERAPEEVTVTLQEMEEAGFGSSPVWWCTVALQDGVIVGFALWYIRYSTWKGCRMYLEDFYVTKKCRGFGIGKLLFDDLQRICREKHLHGMVEAKINFIFQVRVVGGLMLKSLPKLEK